MLKKRIITFSMLFIWIIHLLLFADLVVIDNLKCNYLYLSIGDFQVFTLSLIFTFLIPSALCIGGICSIKIRKKILFVSVFIVCFILLLFWIIVSFLVNGFTRGGITSHTENLENYEVYDSFVVNSLHEYKATDFLPHKSMLSSSSQYTYNYNYGAISETYYIQLQAVFTDKKDYDLEMEKLQKQDFSHHTKSVLYYYSYDKELCMIYSINDAEQTILYTISFGYNDYWLAQ